METEAYQQMFQEIELQDGRCVIKSEILYVLHRYIFTRIQRFVRKQQAVPDVCIPRGGRSAFSNILV